MELLQVVVVQVLAVQPLSQGLVPGVVGLIPLSQVSVVQVVAAQPLSHGLVPATIDIPLSQV